MRDIKFRAWDKVKKQWIPNPRWKICYHDVNVELMQYTGLKDKNGEEIWVGDIVKIDINMFGERIGVVEFFEEEFCVKVDKGYYSGGIRYDFPKVIGNIYENPGLLKEGE